MAGLTTWLKSCAPGCRAERRRTAIGEHRGRWAARGLHPGVQRGQNPGRQLDGIGLDRAHLLLQIRTRVLNDQLADDLRGWYPGFNQAPDPMTLAAYPPPQIVPLSDPEENQ